MQDNTMHDKVRSGGRSQSETEEQLHFEALLIDITAQFANLSADRIDAAIADAQRCICDFLKLDRSVIWQMLKENPGKLVLSHIHDTSGGNLPAPPFDAQKMFPWVLAQILKGETVIISNTGDLPPDAKRDRASFETWGVKSVMVTPLWSGGSIFGLLTFGNLQRETVWSESVTQRLQLVSQLFASAVSRKQAEENVIIRRRIESLMADISSRFISLPVDQIDAEIEGAQGRICECLEVDVSALWQWSDDSPHYLTVTHLHSPPEGPERPKCIDAKQAFPWQLEKVLRGEMLEVITDHMPPEAAGDQEMRRHFGIESSLVIPLSAGEGPVIGILSFDSLQKGRSWPQAIQQRLLLVAQIFANALTRKRAELQLRESQRRLTLATTAAGVGLWVLEPDSGDFWLTPEARALINFVDDQALTYAGLMQMIQPADRARIDGAVQASIHHDEKLDSEFRIVLPDGNARWINASARRISDTKGKGVRLMGALIDISDRRQMENQLRSQLREIDKLKQQLEKENIYLRKEIELQHVHEEIVTRSPAMERILVQAEQVALTDTTVLIEGETGTGKELLARTVHRLSDRKNHPLLTVNCASLPPTLVESELFGREKGAYTGALTRMVGRFEAADGATLFLDEIGEMPFDIQAKLLRVLEQGSFERLGSSKPIQVNVRVIAATNQNLAQQVEAGRFRNDLYYRLNVFPILLPPLRERLEDIPSLVWSFVREYEEKMGRRINRIPRQCMDELQRYAWPGNIRELRNIIERSLIVCSGRTLEVHPPHSANTTVMAHQNLAEFERRHILEVLKQTGWRLSGPHGATRILGLKRTTLQSRMKKLGIQRPPAENV